MEIENIGLRTNFDLGPDKGNGGGVNNNEAENSLKSDKLDGLRFILSEVPKDARPIPENKEKSREYADKVKGTKDILKGLDINVDAYLRDGLDFGLEKNVEELGKRKKILLGVVEKLAKGEDLEEEEQKIADNVNVKKEDLFVEEKAEEPQEPENGEVKTEEEMFAEMMGTDFAEVRKKLMMKIKASGGTLSDSKRFEFLEEKTGGRYSEEMFPAAIEAAGDDDALLDRLSSWCMGLEPKKAEVVQAPKSEFQATIENLPTNKEEWVAAVRGQMMDYLSRKMDVQTLKQKHANFPFELTQKNALGTMKVNGFDQMPDYDGVKAELMKEVEIIERLGKEARLWRTYHGSLGSLSAAMAYPETDPNYYRVPDTEIQAEVLSKLVDEKGEKGEGAAKVTKAISLYFHLANTAGPDGNGILLLNNPDLAALGLDFNTYNSGDLKERRYIKNIFGKLVAETDQMEVRKQVAELCGGEYYEAIAMEMACFMGIAARGSDGIVTGLSYMDKMGYMYWSYASNRWTDKVANPTDPHTSTMWLPVEIRNSFILESGEKALRKKRVKKVKEGDAIVEKEVDVAVPMQLGYDIASMQSMGMDETNPENYGSYVDKNGERKPAKRNFYLVRDEKTGKLLIEKKLFAFEDNEGNVIKENGKDKQMVDSGILMEDILKEGRLGEIDWENSQLDPLRYFRSREKDALALYEKIKAPWKDEHAGKGDWSEGDFVNFAKMIDDAAPNLNKENQQNIAFLWLYSIIYRHTEEYSMERTTGRSESIWDGETMRSVVKKAAETGLISEGDKAKLHEKFDLKLHLGKNFQAKYRP